MSPEYVQGGLAVCSLDCNACDIHRRDPETLAYFASRGISPERVACDGCRSDPAVCHWSPDCEILACAQARHFTYCAECPDLPCDILKRWGSQWEHHARAIERLLEMQRAGISLWLVEHGYPGVSTQQA